MSWISVKEKLPPDNSKKWGVSYLVTIEHSYPEYARKAYSTQIIPFAKGKFWMPFVKDGYELPRHNSDVILWMPIPPRPKTKQNA